MVVVCTDLPDDVVKKLRQLGSEMGVDSMSRMLRIASTVGVAYLRESIKHLRGGASK